MSSAPIPAAEAIRTLLWPRSVAVIGASPDVNRWGGRTMRVLLNLGFEGQIYPVNPKYTQVKDRPCYPDVLDIPEPVDAAVLVLSPSQTLPALERCAEKGVPVAAVLSAGFAEAGPTGQSHQQGIADFARQGGPRVLGPNCMGVANTRHRLSLGPGSRLSSVSAGGVALVSQSGATATWLFSRAQDWGLRLSYLVSSGNEADLDTADFLDFLAADPLTSVICLHVEGLRRGEAFLAAAERAVARGKPVVLLKIGASPRGAQAARSHTGALAGDDRVLAAVCRQAGIQQVETNEELLAAALLFDRARPPTAPGVVVMAPSGGTCGLIADRCHDLGLELPELAPGTAAAIAERLGVPAVANPIDLTSRPVYEVERVRDCLALAAADDQVGLTLLVYTTTLLFERLVPFAAEYAAQAARPLVIYCTAGTVAEPFLEPLRAAGLPVFTNLRECLVAVRALIEFHLRPAPADPEQRAARPLELPTWLQQRSGPLNEPESATLAAAAGLRVSRARWVQSTDEALTAAEDLRYPVVLKVVSRDLPHNSELGGVRLGLTDPKALQRACQELPAAVLASRPGAELEGLLVAEQASGEVELIAGLRYDPRFGPIVLLGMGGLFAEVYQDVVLRRAPLTKAEAVRMPRELRGYPVLAGARGRPPLDEPALVDLLLRLSDLALALGPRLQELDLNPILLRERDAGLTVVDALAVLGPASPAC
jgi:acetyltransferase